MKFLSLIFAIVVLNVSCYGQIKTDDQQAITMLKTYYVEHAKIWKDFNSQSPDVFDKKLEALQLKYCTKKLSSFSKKFLEGDLGNDVLTDDKGIVEASIKTITIVKDTHKQDVFKVTYNTYDDPNKPNVLNRHVTLTISVLKTGNAYKIATVNGEPK